MKDIFIEMLERVKNDLTTAPSEYSLADWELTSEDDYTKLGNRYIEQKYTNTRLSSSGLGDQLELVAEIEDTEMRVRILGLDNDGLPYGMAVKTIDSEDQYEDLEDQYDDLISRIGTYTRR